MHHTPHVAFHEGERCEVFDARIAKEKAEREEEEHRRAEEEEMSNEVVGRTAVECPGCGVRIQKTSGCGQITCKKIPYPFLSSFPLVPERGQDGEGGFANGR